MNLIELEICGAKDIFQYLLAKPIAGFSGLGPRLLRIPLGASVIISPLGDVAWWLPRGHVFCRGKLTKIAVCGWQNGCS